MRNRNKIALLLTTAALLCGLTACGEEDSGVQVLDQIDAPPEYLSFFSSTSLSDSDVSKYWIDLFTETYSKPVYIDFDNASYYVDEGLSYRELLERRLESSAPDDLYIISAEDVLAFERKGYWMDLSDMDFVDNLSESALYQSTYNGKVFSVPLSYTGFGFLWNLDMLAAHDLTVPQNLDEFWNVCRALHENGILPYGANKGYALTVPAMCVGLASLYGSDDLDARIADLNSGKTPISDYMRQGYDFLSQMIEAGYLDPAQALASTPRVDDHALFSAGGCAFICSGLGDLESKVSFPVELTALPVLDNGCVAVYGADKRLCVNPDSKHLDTALNFIEMVGTTEALDYSAALENAMSSAKTSSDARMPFAQSLISQLQQPGQVPNQDFALHFNTWESIRDVARELCGGASVSEACALLDAKQQADLLDYGSD